MAYPIFTKDPQAVLDYTWNWTAWLSDGDTIVASTFTAPTGLTVDDSTFDAHSTTVWLSGGTAGDKYIVTNHVTTSGGRQDDRSITITVKDL